MKIVTCTLLNASTLINGVAFSGSESGMVSEPVADEVAAQFEGIPGYELADAKVAPKEPVKAPVQTEPVKAPAPKAPAKKVPDAPKAPDATAADKAPEAAAADQAPKE